MAKLVGSVQYIGKFKDTVGYKSSAAKKSGTNFVRARAESISNPKTYAQALQRAKAVPAAIFYTAFANVLDHAFLPSGNRSRNQARFRSLAMRLDAIPDVKQGVQAIPCIEYQISEGALGLSSKTFGTSFSQEAVQYKQLRFPETEMSRSALSALSVAEFSQKLISENIGLVDGMELTFMGVLLDKQAYDLQGTKTNRIASYFSVVLNTADTITTMSDVISPLLSLYVEEGTILLSHANEDEFYLLSGGLIISEKTTASWRYTTSRMTIVDPAFVVTDGVVESYMAGANVSQSDKVLQQANNVSISNVVPVSGSTTQFELSPAVEGAVLSASSAAVAVMSSGERRVVTRGGQLLTVGESGVLVPITMTVGEQVSPVQISATTLAGNRQIAEMQVEGIVFTPVTSAAVYSREVRVDPDSFTVLVNENGFLLTDGNKFVSNGEIKDDSSMLAGIAEACGGRAACVINQVDSSSDGTVTYGTLSFSIEGRVITPNPERYPTD